ncbi:membrane-associated proteins in eicosanoid and glutathione metabolism [Fomitiporia mediterranea MF3/22]|uniref:membrane-associated proteins in eicosanoid and glutathione metabolism n=1 Tax=Fomitiporia mediterranea (strain MF3/22) TaxID=694068 RepID=UPI00044095BD|nr:membrane-associated proteins in eicosanoid and glutathione metabolism [Fomitiporia mediterranea MF3/22]EJC99659.1 membrane-associated proteins in eicosanoid and glutathione metabolism [Fomitiporia mediterranea MF3/22]
MCLKGTSARFVSPLLVAQTLFLYYSYSYVLAAAASTIVLNAYQTINVGRARKAAKVPYPQAYAEKAEAASSPAAYRFNCAQRAHQNTLESVPHVILSVLVTGLKYPHLAAALGGAWVIGKVLYTIGYSTGDPNKVRVDNRYW